MKRLILTLSLTLVLAASARGMTQNDTIFIDAATAVLDARCTGHDGDTYTVVTTQVGTQSGMAGWTEQTYELTHEITFDKDNWVVRVDQWG